MWSKLINRFREPAPADEAPDDPPTVVMDPRVADMQKNRVRATDRKIKAGNFDPYNSGAFKRQDAWERVPRK